MEVIGMEWVIRRSAALRELGRKLKRYAESQLPGEERPLALIVHPDDREEVHEFITRTHHRTFPHAPIIFARFEQEIDISLVSERATLVVTEGERLSRVIQDNILEGCYRRPRLFIILVGCDPGELCAHMAPWSTRFRSHLAATMKWPTLPERTAQEYEALFEHGVELAAIAARTPMPRIANEAREVVRTFPWQAYASGRKGTDGERVERYHVKDVLALAKSCYEKATEMIEEPVITGTIVHVLTPQPKPVARPLPTMEPRARSKAANA